MESITLNNQVQIPLLGFGLFGMPQAEQARSVTLQALQNGYRHLDSAARYQNEAAVGEAIAESGIPRTSLFLTTKVWNDMQRSGRVRESLETSLRDLRTEYVDLFLIHWPVPGYFTDTWTTMEQLYHEGLARAIGVCNFRPQDLEALAHTSDTIPAVNQIEIHPYFPQEETIGYCKKLGIQMEAWGTLTSGHSDLLQEPVLLDLAQTYGKTPAQIVIRWNCQRGVIPLVKSASSDRQKQNLDVFDFALTPEDMAQIAQLNINRRFGRDPADSDF